MAGQPLQPGVLVPQRQPAKRDDSSGTGQPLQPEGVGTQRQFEPFRTIARLLHWPDLAHNPVAGWHSSVRADGRRIPGVAGGHRGQAWSRQLPGADRPGRPGRPLQRRGRPELEDRHQLAERQASGRVARRENRRQWARHRVGPFQQPAEGGDTAGTGRHLQPGGVGPPRQPAEAGRYRRNWAASPT